MLPRRSRVWLIAGLATMVLLLAIAIPKYKAMILYSREATLKVNLQSLRGVIKQYTEDKRRAPQSLKDLVDAGYYRSLPTDPITGSTSTWQPVIGTVVISPDKTDRGITNVHSGASSVSSKGTAYLSW